MAFLNALFVLIFLSHLQIVTLSDRVNIKLNLGLNEIHAGMTALSDDEEVRSNNDTANDLDTDVTELQDISLWFDSNGICFTLMEDGYGHPSTPRNACCCGRKS